MQSLQNNIKTKYMNFYIHNVLNLQKTLTIFSEIYPKKAKDIPLNSVILGVAWGCGTSTHQGCQFWSRNCSTTPPGGCLLWPLHPVKRSWLPAWLMQHRLLLPIGKWASKRNINFSDYFSSKINKYYWIIVICYHWHCFCKMFVWEWTLSARCRGLCPLREQWAQWKPRSTAAATCPWARAKGSFICIKPTCSCHCSLKSFLFYWHNVNVL